MGTFQDVIEKKKKQGASYVKGNSYESIAKINLNEAAQFWSALFMVNHKGSELLKPAIREIDQVVYNLGGIRDDGSPMSRKEIKQEMYERFKPLAQRFKD